MFGKRGIRNHIKATFNISQWLAKDALVGGVKRVYALYLQIQGQKKPVNLHETFDEACGRLHINEAALARKCRYYKNASTLYGIFFLASLVYLLILLIKGQWLTVLMGVAYCFLLFSFFFRESFWYMQIKKRRLGMGFSDWLRFITFRLS